MHQHRFEQQHQQSWEKSGAVLDFLERKKSSPSRPTRSSDELPQLYHQRCNQYGLAETRHYSPALVDRLQELVLRGYKQLYRPKTNCFWLFITFLARDFPKTLRRYQMAFWLSFLLFYGSATAIGLATYANPSLIYSVMSEDQVLTIEAMYSKPKFDKNASTEGKAQNDHSMFGFYFINNISIGFRTFAGGILFGAGTVLLLLYNGLFIGSAAGHLSHPPYGENFWVFVSGHAAYELTAIIICGTAGLILGYSLLSSVCFSRAHALKTMGPNALKLVMGGALMLCIAAFIEAFWSSAQIVPEIKYWVAAANWATVLLYFLFAGRKQ